MNSLSWLIYLIGLIEPFTGLMEFGALLFGSWVVLALIIKAMCFDDSVQPPRWTTKLKMPVIGFILCLIVSIMIPSRSTAILIAGSEIGGRMVTSEQVQGAMKKITDPSLDLLQTWIKAETEKLKKNAVEKATGGDRKAKD